MSEHKMFPLQVSRKAGTASGPLQIPWSVAEKAYGAYAKQYGTSQSLQRLAERGGFCWAEMDDLYPGWREETDALTAALAAKDAEIARLTERAEKAEAQHERLRTDLHKLRDHITGRITEKQTHGLDYTTVICARWDKLKAERDRLAGVVERLPKTADGVPVVPGMRLWSPSQLGHATAELRWPNKEYPIHAIGWGMNVRGDECYSTREAAEAARAKGGG